MSLGIPYMGSKRKIAGKLVDYMLANTPSAKYVYDLFGGGGAMSFEFMQRQQIERVHYNEINTGVVELLRKIMTDGVTDEFYQWVTRDDFNELKKGNDWRAGLIKTCWSFGSNQENYLFGESIEAYKRCYHNVVVECIDETQAMSEYCKKYVYDKYGIVCELNIQMPIGESIKERRLNIRSQLVAFEKKCKQIQADVPSLRHLERLQQLQQLERLQQLQQLERLERLERLQQLERLERLERISISNQSAFDVQIDTPPHETIVYLDPPYKGRGEYAEKMCHNELYAFIDTLTERGYKVYLSSYESPLHEVYQLAHRSTLNANVNNKVTERLFCNVVESNASELF